MFNTSFLMQDNMESSVSKLKMKSSAFRRFKSMPKPSMKLDDSFSDNEMENESFHMIGESVSNMDTMLSVLDHDSSGDSGVSCLGGDSPTRGMDLRDIGESLMESPRHTPMMSKRKSRPQRNLFSIDTSSPITTDTSSPITIDTSSPITIDTSSPITIDTCSSAANRKRSREESTTECHRRKRRNLGGVPIPTKPEVNVNTDIISALDSDEDNMISDFSKSYCLPTITGKHSDMKSISPETMAHLVRGDVSETVGNFQIIDCRYPYEFEGGHIRDASNIWERDSMLKQFMNSLEKKQPTDKRNILVFHCEFSSQRGPKMSRFLRKMDREANKDCYPSLYYPELYLLEGGYKAFYEQYPELCDPHSYTTMIHPNHINDVKHFRIKSKSWCGDKSSKVSRRRQLMMQ